MARPRRTNTELIEHALEIVRQPKDIAELREALAVLLPAKAGCTLEQTAQMLGVSRATAARLQVRFGRKLAQPLASQPRPGGRHHSLMTLEKERDFLRPWAEKSRSGGILVASSIRAALAQELGRPVSASVVYRFLARHGWRKVAPDTRHPRSDPQIQQDWKKNSLRRWQPC
jgi:transposase